MFEDADLGGLVERMWASGRSIASGEADGLDHIAEASAALRGLEHWARSAPRLRPLLRLTDALAQTVGGVRVYFDSLLDVLGIATIQEAPEAQRRVQAGIDLITAQVHEVGLVAESLSSILDAEDPAGALLHLGIQAEWSTAEERGLALLIAHIGRGADATACMYALVGDAWASTVGEPEAFWEIVRDHLSVLEGGGSASADILRLPGFSARLGEVSYDTLSAGRRAARRTEAVAGREALTDLLEAGHLVVEQPLKLHLGLACAATTKMTFAATQVADVSELGQIAHDKGWKVAAHLPSSVVRNAFAHRRYAIDGDQVLFSGGRSGPTDIRMNADEVQDAVLRAVEAALAMDIALAIVASEAGVETSAELPATWMAEALMAGLGWSGVSVCLSGRDANAEATLTEDASLASLAFVVHPLSAVADRLCLTLHGPAGSVRYIVPIDMFVAWNHVTEEIEKTAGFIVLSRHITRDGEPRITDAAAQKVLGFTAAEVAADEGVSGSTAVAHLRCIRVAARDLGYQDLSRMLGRMIQWRSSLGTDTAVGYDEIAPILDFLAAPVDQPSGMLLG